MKPASTSRGSDEDRETKATNLRPRRRWVREVAALIIVAIPLAALPVAWSRVQPESALGDSSAAVPQPDEPHEPVGNSRSAKIVAPPSPAERHQRTAIALAKEGRLDEAQRHFETAAQLDPTSAAVRANLGQLFAGRGKLTEAIAQLRESLRLRPDQPDVANNLAWILAVHPDAAARDGGEAVRLAEYICGQTRYEVTDYLNTLAAAYAEAGRFDEAVGTTQRALALAESASAAPAVVEEIGRRAAEYAQKRPLRYGPTAGASQQQFAGLVLRLADFMLQKKRGPEVVDRLARVLATHDDERVRDAALAVRLAQRVVQSPGGATAAQLDTLAAAHAAAGRFADAADLATRAAERAASTGRSEVAEHIESHAQLYREGLTLREPSGYAFEPSADQPGRRFAYVYYVVGRQLAASELGDVAGAAYRQSLRFDPTYAAAHASLGRHALGQRAPRVAAEHFRAALAHSPQDTSLRQQLAVALAESGKSAAARRRFEEILRDHPDDAASRRNLALCLLAEGQVAGAVEQLRAVVRVDPDDIDAANNLAWILATHENPQVRNGGEAVRLAEHVRSLADEPQPDLLNTLAAAYAESGQFDRAVATMREAIDCLDDEASWDDRSQMLARLQLFGQQRPLRNGRQAHLDAAESLLSQGDSAAAAQHLQRAVELDDDDPKTHNQLAVTLAENGQFRQAQHHLFLALRLNPKDASAHANLALLHIREGKFGPAVNHLRHAVELEPANITASNTLAWLLATHEDAALRDADEAVTLAESFSNRAGGDPRLLDTLAAAYAAAGRFDDAVATIDTALAELTADSAAALRRDMLQRKQLYAAGQPYRERIAAKR